MGSKDPLQPAISAYKAGKYQEAEASAQSAVDRASSIRLDHGKPTDAERSVLVESARARYVLAFSAARRRDMKLARVRFQVLKDESAKLAKAGVVSRESLVVSEKREPGDMEPSLEEEGAYQHAVCTAALGDKKGAEAEYLKFMQDYPSSTLLNGCMMRIARLHDGHTPKYADDAYAHAQKIAMKQERDKRISQAMCGPECLAELLRRGEKATRGQDDGKTGAPGAAPSKAEERSGTPPNPPLAGGEHGPQRLTPVSEDPRPTTGHHLPASSSAQRQTPDAKHLAVEMKTGEMGTSLEALAETAKKYGFQPHGLQLTEKGLAHQRLPLIALIAPGHYVIVDKVGLFSVEIWDPYGKGIGRPASRTIPMKQWKQLWRNGIALSLYLDR